MTIAQIIHRLITDQTFAQKVTSTAPDSWPFSLSADDQAALEAVLQRNWQSLCQTTINRIESDPWYQSSTT